jgi:hypothetical protein
MSQGHRPSPGWLSQVLINRHMVNRDLLEAVVTDSPVAKAELPRSGNEIKRNRPPKIKEIPLVQAHATGDAGYLAVAAINLDLNNARPVTINLPLKNASRIVRHYLKGDPRDTNLDELKVTLAEEKLAPSKLANGVFKTQLPAGAASVFVFVK